MQDEEQWEYTETREVQSGYERSFFPLRAVKQWDGLPREVVELPSLEVLGAWLGQALSNLADPFLWAGGWTGDPRRSLPA